MQFSYVKELAESVAGEKVTDVVVTVPPFYTQAERDAVVDAIEIAGLRTLALINDGTAVAINYAMTRTFPEPEIHIVYDAGASSIRTTLVEFSTVESTGKGKPKTYTQVNVLSSGFDRRSGGAELDRRLVKVLVEDFMNKNHVDITKDKRTMSKFRKEANRLKAILSANSEAVSTVRDTTTTFLQAYNQNRSDRECIQGHRLPWKDQTVTIRNRRQRPQSPIRHSHPHMFGQSRLDLGAFLAHPQFFANSSPSVGKYHVCHPHWWCIPNTYDSTGREDHCWRGQGCGQRERR